MKAKSLKILAGGTLIALAGTAWAAEPVTLSNTQLDNVTAGLYISSSDAAAISFGSNIAATFAATSDVVLTTQFVLPPVPGGGGVPGNTVVVARILGSSSASAAGNRTLP